MNRSDIGRVQHQAARTAMPGAFTTRQSTAAAPIGSRAAQYRAAEMQRGVPARRGAATGDAKDDDEDEKPFSGRDDKDDDGADGNTDPDDDKDDDKDVKGKKAKTAA